jgi:hypothetical protein
MRRLLPLAVALYALTGCGAFNAEGRWDIELWTVARDGQALETDDAGWMDWQEDPDYGLRTLLRYSYDEAAFELVPVRYPELVDGAADTYGFDRDSEQVSINLTGTEDPQRAGFNMIEFKTSTMVLESDPMYDGSVHTWELRR